MKIQDQIQSLKDLILHSEYDRTLQLADELLNKDCKTQEKYQILLHKSLALIKLGKINEASKIIDNLETQELKKKTKVAWFRSKAYLLYGKGLFGELLELLKQTESFISNIVDKDEEDQKFLIDTLFGAGAVYSSQFNPKKAFDYFSESLELSEKMGYQNGLASAFHGFSMYFYQKGEPDTAFKYCMRALELRKLLGNKEGVAISISMLGNIEYYRKNYAKALGLHQKCLELSKEIKNQWLIVLTRGNYADFLLFQGNLDESLILFEENASIYENAKDMWLFGGTLGGIAQIYFYKGDIKKSIETFEKSNSMLQKVPHPFGINENYWKIGNIYAYSGDFPTSESNYLRAEKFFQNAEDPMYLAQIYSDLIKLYVDNQELSKAKGIYDKLLEINDNSDIQNSEFITRYCEALILKTSKKFHDIGKAQELLRSVINKEFFDFETQFASMLTLCELLLVELEFSSDEDILNEIKDLINKMEEIAKNANSQILLINILTLKGKFTLLSDGSSKAVEILDQALSISQKKGLEKFSQQIIAEKDRIQKNIDDWVDTLSKNIPISEKLGTLKLKEYLRETIQIVHTKKWNYEPIHSKKCTVFISYAVSDSIKFDIQKIAKELESKPEINKVYCWELWDGFPDGSIIKFMETGIRDSQFFLPVFTKSYNDSINCQKEYEAALAVNKTLIPIFTEIEQVPVLCRAKIGVDTSKFDRNAVTEELFKFVKAELQHSSK